MSPLRAFPLSLLVAAAFSVSTAAGAAIPAPDASGPYGVGREVVTMVDAARGDRSLEVQIWYPVDPVDHVGPPTEYPVVGTVTVVSPLSIDGPPVGAAQFPLIVFSHGSGGINTQSSTMTETLASHGFIVASPNHTGNTTNDLQNGTATPFIESALNRPQDVSFVIDQMLARDATPGDAFESRVRPEDIGVAGHSFGGFTAWAMAAGYGVVPPDPRVTAIMPIAPVSGLTTDEAFSEIDLPIMLLSGTLDTTTPIDDNTTRPFAAVRSRLYRADIVGAGHTHFANVICTIGNALLGVGLPIEAWPAFGAAQLVQPYLDTCTPAVFPLATAERIQNLYAISFFRLWLYGDVAYDDFLTAGYAAAFEPDVVFQDKQPVSATRCGVGFELAFVLLPIAAWRRSRRSRATAQPA